MHTFKNFKNFEYAEIDLSKPMTLLIGRNGSGKSNVIEGVELLAEFLKGRQIEDISDVEQHGVFEIRGNLNGCFRQGTEFFEIGFKDRIENSPNKNLDVEWEIQINLKPTVHAQPLNGRFVCSTKKISTYNLSILRKKYDKVFVFDIYPRLMRQYAACGFKILNRNGANISSILYYLKKNNPDILEKILKRIRQLPEESFESFEFITTSNNDVLFALKYPNGEIISAKLLSDGTLRALAILTALETVPEGSRIIIEEIDNGVHASRVHILIDAIWEASNRRHLNTLITTHNPATLDSLKTTEQLDCVVICHYDKQSQSAKLTPFFELPRADLLTRGGLGKAVVRNIVEQHLEPDYENRQREDALAWLESLND